MAVIGPPVLGQPKSDGDTAAGPASSEAPVAANRDAATWVFESQLERELGMQGGLTSDDVARSAANSSYALEARRAEVRAASAEVDRAFAAYVPKLELLARYARLSRIGAGEPLSVIVAPGVPDGPVDPATDPLFSVPLVFNRPLNQYVLQASLTIPISDYFLRVSKAHAGSKLVESAARKNLAATELAVRADAKTTYYAWVRARLSSIVAALALADAQGHLADVRHAVTAGTASRADLLAMQARVAEGEGLVESTRNLVLQLEEQLRIIRHDSANESYRIGETLADEPPAAAPERLADLTRTALAQRPELEALELRAKSAQAMAAVERAGCYPALALFGNANYDNPNIRYFPPVEKFKATWEAGVQLSWAVTDISAASAAARTQNANAEVALAERRALTDQIRSEVTAAFTAVLDARAALHTSARSLAAAEEAHRARRELFRNGRATSVELMDAQLELTRARLLAATARIDRKVAQVRLSYALGQKPSAPRRLDDEK